MSTTRTIPLFGAFGVELEYMIVRRDTLDVCPIADDLLRRAAAEPGAEPLVEEGNAPEFPNEVGLGDVSWSNELVLHVVEFKTAEPARSLDGLSEAFAGAVRRANALLEPAGAMLMPTGMHPWMDPFREMKLWPHDYSPVYQTFNRIFDCRGHGWANLQAAHLNLPFDARDAEDPMGEFGRLHAALRALLAIMPALSASTPVMDGRATGLLDNRLEVYRTNSRKVPAATGLVIPEPVFSRADYQQTILETIYREYAPHDPDGTLRDEWANSRGCIARFSRGTIEVRVLDVQECPRADLAIVSGLSAVTRALVDGRLGDLALLRGLAVEPLHDLLRRVIRDADRTPVTHEDLRRGLGWRGGSTPTAGELWQHLVEAASPERPPWFSTFLTILSEGCLARRITRALGPDPSRGAMASIYRGLARCLERNELFRPG